MTPLDWKLDKKRPLCPQICEWICVQIACGKLKAGERLQPVREIAVEAGVNPNTVQRSFELLEEQGVLYSVRGSGWFAAENPAKAGQMREQLLREKTAAYFAAMQALGLEDEAVKEYVKEWKQ